MFLIYNESSGSCEYFHLNYMSDVQKLTSLPSLLSSSLLSQTVGFGLGEGAELGGAGVLRPKGMGGRTGWVLDPGRPDEGVTTAESLSVLGWGTSGVWSSSTCSEREKHWTLDTSTYGDILMTHL